MANRIQVRRDTAANWASVNPVLGQGEHGYVLDTGDTKTGDGVTAWNSLAYSSRSDGSLTATYVPKPAGIADGQVAVWNAATSTWVPATPTTAGLSAALSIAFGG